MLGRSVAKVQLTFPKLHLEKKPSEPLRPPPHVERVLLISLLYLIPLERNLRKQEMEKWGDEGVIRGANNVNLFFQNI